MRLADRVPRAVDARHTADIDLMRAYTVDGV
jgi:hypothetical protein